MNASEAPTCSVANGACLAPANLIVLQTRLGTCFRCGNDVCKNCSLRVAVPNRGMRRLCHDCLEAQDGNDARVMRQLARAAGYRDWDPINREAVA